MRGRCFVADAAKWPCITNCAGEPGGVSPGIPRRSWELGSGDESGGLRRPAHLLNIFCTFT